MVRGRTSSKRSYDIAFPTDSATDPAAWRDLQFLFVPGRPQHSAPGHRVWLRHRDVLFYSYEVQDFVPEPDRRSDIDGGVHGPGWSIRLVDRSGRAENVAVASVSDPAGIGRTWGNGLRYLDPGPPLSFVRVS